MNQVSVSADILLKTIMIRIYNPFDLILTALAVRNSIFLKSLGVFANERWRLGNQKTVKKPFDYIFQMSGLESYHGNFGFDNFTPKRDVLVKILLDYLNFRL